MQDHVWNGGAWMSMAQGQAGKGASFVVGGQGRRGMTGALPTMRWRSSMMVTTYLKLGVAAAAAMCQV